MWIFTTAGFVSIVHKDCSPDELMVRAREEGVIEALFPGAQVKKTVGVDYLYRAAISRTTVAHTIGGLLYELDYSNFKDSIAVPGKKYKGACMKVWHVMADTQRIPPYSSNTRQRSFL